MTDERQGSALWPALERLPRGSGVVVRHYSLAVQDRLELAAAIRGIARKRRLTMIMAGPEKLARRARADGFHRRTEKRAGNRLIRTFPAHNRRELVAASRANADLVFLSPAYPTQSHPGSRALGRIRFGMMARYAAIPVVALGGMNAQRGRALKSFGTYGWAAISALTPED